MKGNFNFYWPEEGKKQQQKTQLYSEPLSIQQTLHSQEIPNLADIADRPSRTGSYQSFFRKLLGSLSVPLNNYPTKTDLNGRQACQKEKKSNPRGTKQSEVLRSGLTRGKAEKMLNAEQKAFTARAVGKRHSLERLADL